MIQVHVLSIIFFIRKSKLHVRLNAMLSNIYMDKSTSKYKHKVGKTILKVNKFSTEALLYQVKKYSVWWPLDNFLSAAKYLPGGRNIIKLTAVI